MLVKIFFGLIYSFIMALATFTVVKLPFISALSPNLYGVEPIFQNPNFVFGTYASNLQIFTLIFLSLILKPSLIFWAQLIYLGLAFGGLPIFFHGGGNEYLSQPFIGYVIFSSITAFMVSYFAHLTGEREKNVSKYSITSNNLFLISISGLLLIHVGGSLVLSFILDLNWFNVLQNNILIIIPSQIAIIVVLSIFASFINYSRVIPHIFRAKRIEKRNSQRKKIKQKNLHYSEGFSG